MVTVGEYHLQARLSPVSVQPPLQQEPRRLANQMGGAESSPKGQIMRWFCGGGGRLGCMTARSDGAVHTSCRNSSPPGCPQRSPVCRTPMACTR